MGVSGSDIGSTPEEVGVREEAPDFDAVDYDFASAAQEIQTVTKASAEEVLSRLTIQRQASLADILESHSDLTTLRAGYLSIPAATPQMLQGRGSDFPTFVPAALAAQPVWYLQLPDDWVLEVDALVKEERLSSYCSSDPQNPWRVAQWLTLEGATELSGEWPKRRHLRIDQDEVWPTIFGADGAVNSVVVLIECAGQVTASAYPLDEYLFESLRAGDAASTRDATFTKTRAQLQAETRAVIQHGVPPDAETPVVEVYTLPRASVPGLWGKRRAVHDGSRLVTLSSHSARNSPVGMLPHIADYLAPELASNAETWLKVPLPFRLGSLVDGEKFRLRLVRPNGPGCSEEPPLPTSLVVTGKWFIFRVSFEGEAERRLLKTWMTNSLGRVALEQPWSGYLKTVIIACAEQASWTTEEELQQLVDEAPETVDVYNSSAIDALSWQLLERDVEHRVGPAGGLVSLVG